MSRRSPGSKGRLPKTVLDWSIESILLHDDNDLFSRPFEFSIFKRHWKRLAEELMEFRVDHFRWSEPRRMVLPKDRVSFRKASQLDPLDSLVLTSIVRLLGNKVEKIRLPKSKVFSNRFDGKGTSLYGTQGGWESFWKKSATLANDAKFVARTDIADFYSHVPQAEIIRQLESCDSPERIIYAVREFLSKFSRDGRGVPIGPHPAHLLAELSLAGADRRLEAKGLKFIRYIDDYHVFCESEEGAQLALLELAELLSGEFGLSLNRVKTTVTPAAAFIAEAVQRAREGSVNVRERELLDVIKEVTDSDYDFVDLDKARENNPKAVSDEVVSEIILDCLDSDPVDYPKLAWILRRLSQIGAPGAIELVVDKFESFVPIIGEAARYLSLAGQNWSGEWEALGDRVLANAKRPISERSAYVEMVLYALFADQTNLDHANELLARFDNVHAPAKRELVLAAAANGLTEWLYSLRAQAVNFDPWLTRAYVHSLSHLSSKEAEECLASINVNPQSTDSILLADLTAERVDNVAGEREPRGPSWKAILQQISKSRKRFVEEQLDLLGDRLAAETYKQRDGQFLIATWNLRNFGGAAFGFGNRLPESLAYIARVILSFDFVAIQEVQNKELVDRLVCLLGADWDKVLCGEAVGVDGNHEMTAFLYRRTKATFLGYVEQLMLSRGQLILKKYQFARPPFLAEFKIGKWKLLTGSAHIYFGAQNGAKLDRRIAEIDTLAKLIVKRGTKTQAIPIILGDLNVVGPDHKTMEPLRKQRLALPDELLVPTNASGDKFFTQIAFLPTHDGPRITKSGVFKLFEIVFKDGDLDRYVLEMETSIAWDSKPNRSPGQDYQGFYKKWRTLQLSDHYPVWTDLG
jgi:hypothetical protein